MDINEISLDADKIKERILSIVEAGHLYYGSQLGGLISKENLMEPIRRISGTLKQFIESYMQGVATIELPSQAGGDFKCSFSKVGGGIDNDVGCLGIYQAFSNPNRNIHLFVNSESLRIKTYPKESSVSAPEGYLAIPVLGYDDYRDMIRRFAEKQCPNENDRINGFLTSKYFWSDWWNFAKENQLQVEWSKFRMEQIIAQFRMRITEADMESHLINDYLRCFSVDSQPQKTVINDQVMEKSIRKQDGFFSLSESRRLVNLIVDRMPIEALRDIRIPMGVILDLKNEGII